MMVAQHYFGQTIGHRLDRRYAPQLFAAISRMGRKRTLKDGFDHNRWAWDIVGALTTQVLCQYRQV